MTVDSLVEGDNIPVAEVPLASNLDKDTRRMPVVVAGEEDNTLQVEEIPYKRPYPLMISESVDV